MAKTIFEAVRDKLDDEISVVEGWLTEGRAKNFEDYREMCGNANGLRTARAIVTDLERQHGENDDE